MEIEVLGQPNPGYDFMCTIKGAVGPVRIKAFINSRMLRKGGCPDPPCHEMIFIPPDASGYLVIAATDSRGTEQTWSFSIGTETTGGSMVQTA